MTRRLFGLALLAAAGLAGCGIELPAHRQCHVSADCDHGVCVSGRCSESPATASPAQAPLSGRVEPDAGSSRLDADCPGSHPVTPQALSFNEILVDPPSGPAGDANGDGIRDAYEDEFVELVNTTSDWLDITGVRVYSGDRLVHWFGPMCLEPNGAVAVFGGGVPASRGATNLAVSETRFAFRNEDGSARVELEDGRQVGAVAWEAARGTSITRAPPLIGAWVRHDAVSLQPFSPGTCANGDAFATGCHESTSAEVDAGEGD